MAALGQETDGRIDQERHVVIDDIDDRHIAEGGWAMGRTVVTRQDAERQTQAARQQAQVAAVQGAVAGATAPTAETPDTYKDRLLKYIPAEIVAIYLALLNVVKAAAPNTIPVTTVEWVLFGIILAVAVPWQLKIAKITKWQQVAVGVFAFAFWAISLGDPFDASWKAWYHPLYGTLAMMLYTFLIPLFQAESV